MQYFTSEWVRGILTDAESEAVVARYNRYLSTLDRSSAVWRFATSVSLNDAYLDRLIFDSRKGNLQLLLLTGDLQVGYWHTRLVYAGATIDCGMTLLRDSLSRRPAEILYDEFSGEAGRMSHGFLLKPAFNMLTEADEVRISFKEFSYTQVAAESRSLLTSDDQSEWA
ncbi:hypothetical protein [Ferrovibrio terrae]|uniref:hypothetical protein n=1 Tax=Ferrovibrio terrae TaxID=2594003 RepID=UPI003137C9DC